MNRRDLLQILGGAVTLEALSALTPQRLLALGEEIHRSAVPLGRAAQPALLAALSERILPESDTPGAIAVGVPAFIEVIIHHWMTDEERTRFEKGLTAIDAAANARFKGDFANLTNRTAEHVDRRMGYGAAARAWQRRRCVWSRQRHDCVRLLHFQAGRRKHPAAQAHAREVQRMHNGIDGVRPPNRGASTTRSSSAPASPAAGRPRSCASAGSDTLVLEAGRADRPRRPTTSSTCQPWQLPFRGWGDRQGARARPADPAQLLRLRRVVAASSS